MRDYIDLPSKKSNNKFKPWIIKLLIILCGISCMIFAFAYLSYRFNLINTSNNDNNAEESNIGGSISSEELTETFPQPPTENEYDFYNVLSKEEAVRIDRPEEKQVLAASKNIYYIIVEDYASYEQAKEELKKMHEWGMNNFKIEPYSKGYEFIFRIRIGPFVSRSNMNAKRDILYDNDIPNKSLVLRK